MVVNKGDSGLDSDGFFCPAFTSFPAERFQEVADGFVLLGLAPQRHIGVEAVSDASPFFVFGNIAVCFEIVDDIARGFFGNAYGRGYFTGGNARLLGDKAEHHGMVGEEFPSRHDDTSLSFACPGKYFLSFRPDP